MIQRTVQERHNFVLCQNESLLDALLSLPALLVCLALDKDHRVGVAIPSDAEDQVREVRGNLLYGLT